MEIDIKCPSGMVGKIRALKVKDEVLFTDGRLAKSGKLIEEMVRKCWLELISPGPYDFENGSITWGKILQGDSFWLFLQARKLTYGHLYPVTVDCSSCGNPTDDEIDLNLLEMKTLPEAAIKSLTTGEPMTTKLADGREVKFRLLLAEDDSFIQNFQEIHELTQKRASLLRRLVLVEGINPREQMAMVTFLQEMDSGDADDLEDAVEELDCGVDTDVLITCKCGGETVMPLPLQATFFRKNRKKSKKERKLEQLRRAARERTKKETQPAETTSGG